MLDMAVTLAELAMDESCGACKYGKMALLHKGNVTAQMLASITEQELAHAETLYAEAERVLKENQSDSEEYKSTRAIVTYIRAQQVKKSNQARIYLYQFKNG